MALGSGECRAAAIHAHGVLTDGKRIAVAVASATTRSPVPVRQRLFLLALPSGRVVWESNHPLRPGQNQAYVAFTPLRARW